MGARAAQFSVSGRVRQPGVKLAPAGITLRELIDEYCGGMADGPHPVCLPARRGQRRHLARQRWPMCRWTLTPCSPRLLHRIGGGGGAQPADRARDAALNAMQFFADESCGQCTPCRVGTAKAAALMQRRSGMPTRWTDLAVVMADASICGLGQAAPNPSCKAC
jgi:NADH:ubiquinone oxidoreductase subunit F (NADH-binding)